MRKGAAQPVLVAKTAGGRDLLDQYRDETLRSA